MMADVRASFELFGFRAPHSQVPRAYDPRYVRENRVHQSQFEMDDKSHF